MDSHGELAGAAKRRRDRWFRSWHRHVRTTVAMELATALHHSAQRVEEPREEAGPVTHYGDRRSCLHGCGWRLWYRWLCRRTRESRSVTWLPPEQLLSPRRCSRVRRATPSMVARFLVWGALKTPEQAESNRSINNHPCKYHTSNAVRIQ